MLGLGLGLGLSRLRGTIPSLPGSFNPTWELTPEAIPAGMVFSRGTLATQIGADGGLEYAPHNLAQRSQFSGAAVGSPGTMGTGWVGAWQGNGLSSEVVAFGTLEDGNNYVDLRIYGTTTASGSLILAPTPSSTQFPVTAGRKISASYYVQRMAGSIASLKLQITGRTSAGAFVDSTNYPVPNVAGIQYLPLSYTWATSGVTYVEPSLRLDHGTGLTFDFTVRIWGLQVNYGNIQTLIPTSGTAYHGLRTTDYSDSLGTALVRPGIKIESSSTNLLLQTEDPTNAAWTLFGTGTRTAVFQLGSNWANFVADSGQQIGNSQAITLAVSNYTFQAVLDFGNLAASDKIRLHVQHSGANTCYAEVGKDGLWTGSGTYTAISTQILAPGVVLARLTFAATAAGTGTFYVFTPGAGDGSKFWKAGRMQVEQRQIPTSYIPTSTASVARSADVLYWPTANIGSYNSAEFTLAAEHVSNSLGQTANWPGLFKLIVSGTNSRLGMYIQDPGADIVLGEMRTAASVSNGKPVTGSTVTALVPQKSALRATGGTYAPASKGIRVDNQTLLEAVAYNQLHLGVFDAYLDGTIYSLKYYPTPATDAQLISLTS